MNSNNGRDILKSNGTTKIVNPKITPNFDTNYAVIWAGSEAFVGEVEVD